MAGTIYLIPTPVSDDAGIGSIAAVVRDTVLPLRHFIVEEERTARRFLRKLDSMFPIDSSTFAVYNEHSSKTDVLQFLEPLKNHDIGLMSEAGAPCVADPGAEIVAAAHKLGFTVVPLPGPSSILMALMASGLNGQSFAFHGYLPVKKEDKDKEIRRLERESAVQKQTKIVMDAPYRNRQLFDSLVETLSPSTMLCVAYHISSPEQYIKTIPVKDWKTKVPVFEKQPALFLFCA